MLGEHGRLLHVHVPGERADGDVVAGVLDVRQVLHVADVDEHSRLGEAQFHERDEAVAARQEFRFVAVLADERDGFLRGTGPLVLERCGNHCLPP